MKFKVFPLVQLITIFVSIGDAIGQQFEARLGGPGEDFTGSGYSLTNKRRDEFARSQRNYDTDFDAVSSAFQNTDESLRDRQTVGGGLGGRHNNNNNNLGSRGRPHNDCDNNDITECVGLLEVLTNNDLGFAASVDELNSMCPVLLNGLQCIDNYTRRCLSQKHREYFNKLYAGTIRVIKDLCNTKGKYQLEYIRHAPCMRQVNPKYNGCSEAYHKKTADLNQINDAVVQLSDEEKNKNVITLCCSFQEYLQCSEQVVLETCGNETALFTKEFLDRMAGPIVQDLCQAFSFSLHLCVQESSTSNHTSTEDSQVKTGHHSSTFPPAPELVLAHSSQPQQPHLHSELLLVTETPSWVQNDSSFDKLILSDSDNISKSAESDLVSEGNMMSLTTVAGAQDVKTEEPTEAKTFKCLNYAPGSQDCSAGVSVVTPAKFSLTLVAATLFVYRWFHD